MNDKIPAKIIDSVKTHKPQGESSEVDLYQSRPKIYVKEIHGFFQKIRQYSLLGLMGAFFLVCWINVDGQQWVYFDLPARQFHLFGTTFWPQDFVLLAWLLIICAFGLFFITTLFGRVWCGYTCPQTVWTFVFMWFEERFEGSRNQRMKLDQQPWNAEKIRKKGLKHFSWLAVGFLTGLTFVGYFYPVRELVPDLFTFSATSGWAYFWVMFFTVITYLNAGWLRENVCLYMCPYARFQSVMFDQDTLIVSYNPGRGEPRGSRKRSEDHKAKGLGDCIDCNMCVQVCPTGIDIRDGLQYECIGCALCVDACDSIMEKMNYPKGLVSYTREKTLLGLPTAKIHFRTVGYGIALIAITVAFMIKLGMRTDISIEALRDRGSLYQTNARGYIENSYTLKIVNMADETRTFDLGVDGMEGLQISEQQVTLQPAEVLSLPVVVEIDPARITDRNTDIRFFIEGVDLTDKSAETESRFMGPGTLR